MFQRRPSFSNKLQVKRPRKSRCCTMPIFPCWQAGRQHGCRDRRSDPSRSPAAGWPGRHPSPISAPSSSATARRAIAASSRKAIRHKSSVRATSCWRPPTPCARFRRSRPALGRPALRSCCRLPPPISRRKCSALSLKCSTNCRPKLRRLPSGSLHADAAPVAGRRRSSPSAMRRPTEPIHGCASIADAWS